MGLYASFCLSTVIAFSGGQPSLPGLACLLMSEKESQSASKQLERAKATMEAANFDISPSLIPGDAESVIAKAVREQGIDMLIIGAYSHSPLRSLLLGSKTSDLLRSAKVPTLLFR